MRGLCQNVFDTYAPTLRPRDVGKSDTRRPARAWGRRMRRPYLLRNVGGKPYVGCKPCSRFVPAVPSPITRRRYTPHGDASGGGNDRFGASLTGKTPAVPMPPETPPAYGFG